MARQLALASWPIGVEEDAVVLALAPGEISKRAAIRFELGEDGLDKFDGALLVFGNKHVVLQHYRYSPVEGTKVVVAPGDRKTLARMLHLLGVSAGELVWTADRYDGILSVEERVRKLRLRLQRSRTTASMHTRLRHRRSERTFRRGRASQGASR